MATSNFFSRSGYYFASDSEDTQLELESLTYDLDSALNLRNFQICNTKHRDSDYLGSMIQGEDTINFTKKSGYAIDVLLNVYVNYGYYAGYTVDFDFTYCFSDFTGKYMETDETPTPEDLEGLVDFNASEIEQAIDAAASLEEKLQATFLEEIRGYGLEELKVVGRASNGETFYTSVSK